MNNVSDDATGVKHTRGPWIIEDESEGAIWVASENPPPREQYWTTAKCYGPNAKANARLIAAAPDLLKELKWIAGRIDRNSGSPNFTSNEYDRIRDIIAKAEGR